MGLSEKGKQGTLEPQKQQIISTFFSDACARQPNCPRLPPPHVGSHSCACSLTGFKLKSGPAPAALPCLFWSFALSTQCSPSSQEPGISPGSFLTLPLIQAQSPTQYQDPSPLAPCQNLAQPCLVPSHPHNVSSLMPRLLSALAWS